MKFILGTAQFGTRYGITNKKKPNKNELAKIFKTAKNNNINILDTANTYKNINKIIQNYSKKKFNIILKIKLGKKKNSIQYNDFFKQIREFNQNLNLNRIYCLMLHDENDINNKNFKNINEIVKTLKNKKIIRFFGLSIYNPIKNIKNIKRLNMDIIECPYNIIDRRIENKNFLKEIKKRNIKIYVRSIFLQGLLIDKNFYHHYFLKKWFKLFKKINSLYTKNNISAVQACINFVKQNKNISKIIIGVNSYNHLIEILNLSKKKKIFKTNNFNIKDTNLLNPSKWS